MRVPKRLTCGAALAAAVLLIALAPSLATPGSGERKPRVLPPQASASGQSYADWADCWWQWALSFPTSINPMLTNGEVDASLGQEGNVWFLAGIAGVGGVAERTVTIPPGKALFFPIVNQIWVNLPELGDNPWSDEQEAFARALNAAFIDGVEDLSCTIDGTPVVSLDDSQTSPYRVATQEGAAFLVHLPDHDPAWWELPEGDYGPCVADGVYLMLAPLPAGQHDIRFTAGTMDVTYHITVKQ